MFHLFQMTGLPGYFGNLRQTVTDQAQEWPIDEIDGPTAVDDIAKKGQLELVELQRSKARFTVDESSDGLRVDLVVPFTGDNTLLSYQPSNAESLEKIRGQAAGDKVDATRSVVQLHTTFPVGTQADEARAWGKAQTDLLERWVDHLNADIREHNQHMDALAMTLVRERREHLADADRLRAELDQDGI